MKRPTKISSLSSSESWILVSGTERLIKIVLRVNISYNLHQAALAETSLRARVNIGLTSSHRRLILLQLSFLKPNRFNYLTSVMMGLASAACVSIVLTIVVHS